MTDEKTNRPLTFKIAYWYGLIFSGIFILYGGVQIILGILDRNYSEMMVSILSLLVGIILISFAFAYKELKKWGWYGLIAINALVIILALFDYTHYENIVLMIFSMIALFALFSSSTKQYLLRQH